MVFHSYEFIFVFLPITFLGFVLTQKIFGLRFSLFWLTAASVFFYASWSLVYSLLLTGSIIFNYCTGRLILRNSQNYRLSFSILAFALTSNLAMLGYFKYTNLCINSVNTLLGTSLPTISVVLPVGISFFTFYQIIYLIAIYTKQAQKHDFLGYFLFVTFFPYVTAGPIVLQQEIFPQYAQKNKHNFQLDDLVIGLSIFSIGLFKKLVFADGIAPYADIVFNTANNSMVVAADAWLGTLAYSLQIYFDFSGYSDMAIGLGCMFGIKLPLNFNSPYKATSISDFWRRWHMTLTRFFTTFVYLPLAVKLTRLSLKKAYSPALKFMIGIAVPTIVTFALAGLWHGAGWNFVIFGLIHGVALTVNHYWRQVRLPSPSPLLGWALTMGVVLIGLVFFRANSNSSALVILQGMLGINEVLNISKLLSTSMILPWITILSAIALLAPNTQELMRYFPVTTDVLEVKNSRYPKWLAWRPIVSWALFCTTLFVLSIFCMKGNTNFLYYQF